MRDEAALAASLRELATELTRNPRELLLVGIEPEEADPELGYIVPDAGARESLRTVQRFVEKPEVTVARSLLKQGALWNSFIFAAHGPALLGMIREASPGNVELLETAIARDARIGTGSVALQEAYEELESLDFSRGVMQNAAHHLRVLTAPACGWSDLGTPQRVAETLKRCDPAPRREPVVTLGMPAFINLAAQHARLAVAG